MNCGASQAVGFSVLLMYYQDGFFPKSGIVSPMKTPLLLIISWLVLAPATAEGALL